MRVKLEGNSSDDELRDVLLRKFNEKYHDADVPEGFIGHGGKAYWVRPDGSYRLDNPEKDD